MLSAIKRFLASEEGPTAVEYAVMLALIIMVCMVSISQVGSTTNDKFDQVKNYLT